MCNNSGQSKLPNILVDTPVAMSTRVTKPDGAKTIWFVCIHSDKAYSFCNGCRPESCIDDIQIYIPADNRNTPRIDGAREYTSIYHARTHDSL